MGNKIALIFLFLAASAVLINAHPLGNFSVNNYSRIEIENNRIRLRCVLDMAEIPTFQESQTIDADKNKSLSDEELAAYLEKLTAQYAANLKIFIDDEPVQLQIAAKNISLPTGAGDLPTLRLEWGFEAATPSSLKDEIRHFRFENFNFKERVGWNEIVVVRAVGINVFDSSAFGSAVTDELKNYPEDMLSAPLAEREAKFSFTAAPAAIPANARELQNRNGSPAAPVQKDKLAELISVREITPTIVLIGLLIAFGLGMMHALSPGHGKTVVGAYLVGSKGTIKHAAFLGLTVTVTHTLGVFALGVITIFASQFILPERLMPFLSFVSGLLVLFIGLSLFKGRLLSALGYVKHQHHYHEHGQDNKIHDFDNNQEQTRGGAFVHTHDGHTHSHAPPESVTWGSLLALGVSGGLLPCPSALVLMLSAISFDRVGYGLLLTLAFSVGLAATLMCIGLAFLYLGKFLDRPSLSSNPIVKALPVFSAFVIACLGAVICYNSLT